MLSRKQHRRLYTLAFNELDIMKLCSNTLACLLFISAAASLEDNSNSNRLRRRAYVTYISSSDGQNMQEPQTSKYNCDGMFSDVSGPSEETSGMEQILVKYAYDLFLAKGSSLNKAIVGLQSRLLLHIGESIFNDCDSDNSLIKEITMTSNDAQHPTDSCKVEADFEDETNCFPMKGRARVYFSPSEQVDQTDEELIIDIMSTAVKSAMDNDMLVTDTVKAAYFIGERDSFNFESSEYYNSKGSASDEDNISWADRNAGWVAGTAATLGVIFMFFICFKCRKKKASTEN